VTWTGGRLPGTAYQRRLARRVLIDGRWIAVNARYHNRHTYVSHRCECEICAADYSILCAQRWAEQLQRRTPRQSKLARRA
jgi:hypothetical protein